MSPHSAQIALGLAEIYGSFGAVVATVCIVRLGRLDPSAKGAYAFRLLLLPGLIALWPYAIWRLVRFEADGDFPQ